MEKQSLAHSPCSKHATLRFLLTMVVDPLLDRAVEHGGNPPAKCSCSRTGCRMGNSPMALCSLHLFFRVPHVACGSLLDISSGQKTRSSQRPQSRQELLACQGPGVAKVARHLPQKNSTEA